MDFEKFYKEGGYLEANPDWDESDSDWKGAMMVKLLEKNNVDFNSLTEVGCGAGGIVTFLAKKFTSKKITGYDVSPQAIDIASQKITEVPNLDFFNRDYINEPEAYADIVVMADVLEHVVDYYTFLKKLKSKGRQFVFHIPLDLSCRSILKPHITLQQRKTVGHIHYFAEEHVWWMLNDCGFLVKDWHYTTPAVDRERPKSFKQFVKKKLRSLSFKISKKWSVKLWGGYSLLILAE